MLEQELNSGKLRVSCMEEQAKHRVGAPLVFYFFLLLDIGSLFTGSYSSILAHEHMALSRAIRSSLRRSRGAGINLIQSP